jgi:hypothetical protein
MTERVEQKQRLERERRVKDMHHSMKISNPPSNRQLTHGNNDCSMDNNSIDVLCGKPIRVY